MLRPPCLGWGMTNMQQRRRPIAATRCVLCDRSRSGYAIVHGVCACAAPVRDRIHAEAASIGETVFKMSPPFGTLALTTRTPNISWRSAYRKHGFGAALNSL